jgi:hypothetical protein
MILIFSSWIILLYCFLGFGIAAESLLKFTPKNIAITLLIGMAAQTVGLTFLAFFVPIGFGVGIANLIAASFLILKFRELIIESLKNFGRDFRKISILLKATLLIILLSALFKCAQSPFILDNERYYVQTIKWLNEYGFVKGLGNLDVAFGQTSAWHIMQSGFNFNFLTNRINDLNGFLLVVCSFWFISKFDAKLKEENQFHWIGFIVLFNLLSYQFLNAPSPDLPLFLIAQVIFLLFLENKTADDIKIIVLLFVFLAFIKITIAPLGLLLIFLFWREKRGAGFFITTSFVFGSLWMAKNIFLSGYPLYPFAHFPIDLDWTVPKKVLVDFNHIVKNHEFLAISHFADLSYWDKFLLWMQFGGINGIFNKGIVLLFALAPFTQKMRTIFEYRLLYVALLIHFITIFLMSPQFRFFLPEFIFLSALVLSDILNRMKTHPKWVASGLLAAAFLPVFAIYFINLKSLTTNRLNQDPEKVSWQQLYLPEKNSKFGDIGFVKLQNGNLDYYSPAVDFYIYGTADGPLPCINKNQINYFEKHMQIIPQLRRKSLNDGFYSKEITVK